MPILALLNKSNPAACYGVAYLHLLQQTFHLVCKCDVGIMVLA